MTRDRRVINTPDGGGPIVIRLPVPRRLLGASWTLPLVLVAILACLVAPLPGAAEGVPEAKGPASTTAVPGARASDVEAKQGATAGQRWSWVEPGYAAVTGADATAPGLPVPALALDSRSGVSVPAALWAAYLAAVAASPPSCHLDVRLLAAIGQVESGSLRGRGLDARHRAVPGVFGPILSGGSFAAIRDTDHGRWDGNTTWDRAVGPMQFIPSTWATHGRDADGDGVADPQDVEDATLSAALYLCAGGRDLSQPAGLRAAILSYNYSQSYLATVLALMSRVAPGGPSMALVSGAGLMGPVVPAVLPGAPASTPPTATPSATPTAKPTVTASVTQTSTPPSTTTTASPTSSSTSSTEPTTSPTTTTTASPTSSTTTEPSSPTSSATCSSSPSSDPSTQTSSSSTTTTPTAETTSTPPPSSEPSVTSSTAAEESLTSTTSPTPSPSCS